MFKIRDRMLLGTLGGLLAAIPVRFMMKRQYSMGNMTGTGVLLSYLLSLTGTDKAILKGMAVGSLSWVLVDGFLASKTLKNTSNKPLEPALGLVNHMAYGALCSVLISKLGDRELFPNTRSRGFSGQRLSDRSYSVNYELESQGT